MWEIALALAKAILEDQERREEAAADDERALAIIREVLSAIDQAKDQILNFLRQQQQAILEGEVDGLFTTFARYAEDPAHNGERLRELIDNLALRIGHMARLLRAIDSDEQTAVGIFPTYASAVALTALAITERRHRFHLVESMAGVLEQAKGHSLRVRDVLRLRSDSRFQFTVKTEPGDLLLGYTFNGVFHPLAVVPMGGNTREAREHVNRTMAIDQDRKFQIYPGVPELLSFIRQLDDSISLDSVRLAAISHVPLFEAVVEEPQDGPQRRFRLA